MSTESVPQGSLLEKIERNTVEVRNFGQVVLKFFQGLASLKLTVALFAMAIFLVLGGTMAQHRKDIWLVVEQYFRVPLWPNFGFAWMEFQDFLPPSFFPSKPQISGGFPFPGGTLIGGLMAINLLAAHGLRFKPQAKGNRLWAGLGVIGIGVLVTAAVIFSGSNKGGVQESIWGDWSMLWVLMKGALGVAFLASVGGYFWMITRTKSELWLLGLAGLVPGILGAVFFYTLFGGADAALDGPSLRILWQLMKGAAAGLVLLAGCAIVFKKRAGIVLLHAGVGLMMFSEVQVAMTAVEGQMWIREGESVNFVRDVRKIELAVVDLTDPENVRATVIPESVFLDGGIISNDQLPFNIEVVKFIRNADVRRVGPQDENLATAGAGTELMADEVRAGTGADTGGQLDLSTAYLKLTSKDGKTDLGTYLVSIWFDSPIHTSHLRNFIQVRYAGELPQQIDVDGKKVALSLRFKRDYKPYTMRLDDVRKEDYIGTSQPRDYSSFISLEDPSRNVKRSDIRIWMNNPLRFAGETFYQSSYIPDPYTGVESTSLSVVTNGGWMIPYVSCMIVATGMLAHFLFILIRFINRQQKERKAAEPAFDANDELQPTAGASSAAAAHVAAARRVAKEQKAVARRVKRKQKVGGSLLGEATGPLAWIFPLVIVFICALYVGSKSRPPKQAGDGMDLFAFGQIPVVYQGRQKPLDTLARNALRVVSNRQTFYGRMTDDVLREKWPEITGDIQRRWPKLSKADLNSVDFDVDQLIELIGKQTDDDREQIGLFVDEQVNVKQPAIRWLLDIIARPDRAEMHKVFRIENLEVIDTLGLPRRDGYRYAVDEFRDQRHKLEEQAKLAQTVSKETPEKLSTYQRKILELDTRVRTFTLLVESFRLPRLPRLPNEKDFKADPQANMKAFEDFRKAFAEARGRQDFLQKFSPPLLVPVDPDMRKSEEIPAGWGKEREEWESYAMAWLNDYSRQALFDETPNAPTLALQDIFLAYTLGDADEFNSSVEKYQNQLSNSSGLNLTSVSRTRFEAFFNYFEPFFYSILLYFFAFVLGCVAFLLAGLGVDWWRPMRNASTGIISFTLLLHTFALVSRIYISGRPPVTNLYSSAIFIGWGCVVLGLVVEMIFRIGIGNILSSVAGFATLWIAHLLAGDGDTFTVLQAVLDTQFWLATHVTTITLGYATTFAAGLIGVLYVIFGFATPAMSKKMGRDLGRMIYGTLCFAILFSFVGTVLGGLWADDSWGRFWGWDPKENGALIIVLWNALVLHARWGGMVKERGLAVLAIGGNIVTAWSWFGVNELGVGLHSYGFTQGVLLALLVFVLSQVTIIFVGMLPKDLWWSYREQQSSETV